MGDPNEAGALVAVHGSAGGMATLAVGAAKANLGHGEASSGCVGILKGIHQVVSRLAPTLDTVHPRALPRASHIAHANMLAHAKLLR